MVRSAGYRGQIVESLRAFGLALVLSAGGLSHAATQTLSDSPSSVPSETLPAPTMAPIAEISQDRPSPPRRQATRPARITPQPALPPVAATAPLRASLDATRLEAYVDGLVLDALKREKIAGASVAIVQNGQTVLLKGYGYARLNPVTRVDPNVTLFRLGSISKTFTWVAAMQEVESGRLSLDKPIEGFLPEDIDFEASSAERKLTLRDIMGQASGYEDTGLGHLFALNPNKILSVGDYLSRHKPRRVRDPGEFATYSNYASGLAAAATVQSAKARDYPTLAEARILTPLGMRNTTFREPYAAREDLPAPISPRLAGQLSEGFSWDGATLKPRMTEHLIHIAGV
ncbi:MAG: serine hydrolase domain-containing protein, partial [Asticcacaulis sp.]